MPFQLLHVETLDEKKHKSAYDRLRDFLPRKEDGLSAGDFVVVKRLLELYLKNLDIKVLPVGVSTVTEAAVSLSEFARTSNKRVLDMVVDDFDPDEGEDPSTNFLKLSPTLDDIFADDLLGLAPKDIDYLSSITGNNRVNKILRRMGANYYLSKDSQAVGSFQKLLDLAWEDTEPIQTFNQKFEMHIGSLTALNQLKEPADQFLF